MGKKNQQDGGLQNGKHGLSRRERQIMDVIYERGEATVAEVLERIPDPPSYSAVRATMRLLEEKGHIHHKQRGLAFVYLPTVEQEQARTSALKHVLKTFFNNSPSQAVAALLDLSTGDLDDTELERLESMIEQARTEGR